MQHNVELESSQAAGDTPASWKIAVLGYCNTLQSLAQTPHALPMLTMKFGFRKVIRQAYWWYVVHLEANIHLG